MKKLVKSQIMNMITNFAIRIGGNFDKDEYNMALEDILNEMESRYNIEQKSTEKYRKVPVVSSIQEALYKNLVKED